MNGNITVRSVTSSKETVTVFTGTEYKKNSDLIHALEIEAEYISVANSSYIENKTYATKLF